MVALYTTFYNFARINSAVRMSPAMAWLEQRLGDMTLQGLIEDHGKLGESPSQN